MAGFGPREKGHFPLQSIQAVVALFKEQLKNSDEPDLALLSIVLGCIENTLTMNRSLTSNEDRSKILEPIFPVVELSTVEALYAKFTTLVKGAIDMSHFAEEHTTRELVKKVSDVIWSSLTRSYYKDRAHLQSLYSFLTGALMPRAFILNIFTYYLLFVTIYTHSFRYCRCPLVNFQLVHLLTCYFFLINSIFFSSGEVM